MASLLGIEAEDDPHVVAVEMVRVPQLAEPGEHDIAEARAGVAVALGPRDADPEVAGRQRPLQPVAEECRLLQADDPRAGDPPVVALGGLGPILGVAEPGLVLPGGNEAALAAWLVPRIRLQLAERQPGEIVLAHPEELRLFGVAVTPRI